MSDLIQTFALITWLTNQINQGEVHVSNSQRNGASVVTLEVSKRHVATLQEVLNEVRAMSMGYSTTERAIP